ncbi:hypothetical protein QYM36_011126 [Artemia franciscana]|uniref:Uncharacterized protein n=1 Tax=Artemia franciscana TaxID=6661 RepID=A0AA88L4D7_ARTSF|nr:hypothetical protein QYM36_011126 [Artemia franciscana]
MMKKTFFGKKIDNEQYENIMKFLNEGKESTNENSTFINKKECVNKPTSPIKHLEKVFPKKEVFNLIADDYYVQEGSAANLASEDISLDDSGYYEEEENFEEMEQTFEEY